MKKTLVIVDVQRDFFHPEGLLYVPGSEVLPELIAPVIAGYDSVVLTLDWHPGNHCSFKENGGIWPSHCVAYTQGAGLPDCFSKPLAREGVHYFQKGKDAGKEQYGAFEGLGPGDGIYDLFEASDRIDVCGIVGEYCVQYTIANMAELGFKDKIVALTDLIAYFDGGAAFGKFVAENGIRTEKKLK